MVRLGGVLYQGFHAVTPIFIKCSRHKVVHSAQYAVLMFRVCLGQCDWEAHLQKCRKSQATLRVARRIAQAQDVFLDPLLLSYPKLAL